MHSLEESRTMIAKIHITPLVFLALAMGSVYSRSVFKLSDIRCTALDASFCNFTACSLKAIKRDVTELTVRVTLLQKPVDHIKVYFSIKRRGYEHLKPLLEYSVDACAFLRNKRRNPLVETFYTLCGFKEYSNMNHTCPYDHDLAMEKTRFSEAHVRLIPIPSGYYVFDTMWTVENIPRGNVSVFFHFSDK